jgi:glycosyltransferase involved in cell wall biosynthesis
VYPYTISIIVPALNEEAVVGTVVEQILGQVRGRFLDWEVILVDDGSTDSTGRIMDQIAAREEKVQVIHNPKNLRFGNSYRRGLVDARFEYVMLLCGDGGLPASSLPHIFDKIGSADIVIPWMLNLREIKTTSRYLLSRAYTGLVNLLFGLKLHYYNGLPVHRRELLQSIEITSGGFGFQAEILVKLIKSGATYVEVGVKGAEETNESDALRIRNWLSVFRTVYHLLREMAGFQRVSAGKVRNPPAPSAPSDTKQP